MSDKQGERNFISDALHSLGHAAPGDPRRGAMARMFHQQVLHGPDGKSADSADPALEQVAVNVLGQPVVDELRRHHRVFGPHRL